jgi:hypothetical protein
LRILNNKTFHRWELCGITITGQAVRLGRHVNIYRQANRVAWRRAKEHQRNGGAKIISVFLELVK